MKYSKNTRNTAWWVGGGGTWVCIVFLLVFVSIIIIILIANNYYYGKYFKLCNTCNPNEYFIIDNISPPDDISINNLLNENRSTGSILDPNLNFNNAKGKKLNYNQLPDEIKLFYDENNYLREKVSKAVGENVYYADNSEKYRIFSRLYENEDDFLDWHYDNNFTIGNRYTLVIPLIVDNGNTSEFMIKDRKTQEEIIVPVPLGKGVVYNGSVTYHKISQQTDGQRRMVVIIPFYTNYKKTFFGKMREFVRNVTYQSLKL
jgi:hypothetical protein